MSIWSYLCLSLCLGAASVTSCRVDWIQFEESCYGFGELQVTWEEAVDVCKSAGAKLAEIETSEENEFIKSQARQRGGYWWLGATDIFKEGTWTWMSTGAQFDDFDDWETGEPDGAQGQNCLHLHAAMDFKWDDSDCSNENYFICETGLEEAVFG